ncbi:MAG TPA: hypothetical protein H9903_02480 [Candidatus Aquabacterium excrementipullorum]|nr:hypothetical protein [Candidatus Aquabacterium excrementipullorum]
MQKSDRHLIGQIGSRRVEIHVFRDGDVRICAVPRTDTQVAVAIEAARDAIYQELTTRGDFTADEARTITLLCERMSVPEDGDTLWH